MEVLVQNTTAKVQYTQHPHFMIYELEQPSTLVGYDFSLSPAHATIVNKAVSVITYLVKDLKEILERWNTYSEVYVYCVTPIPGRGYYFRFYGKDKT